MILVIAAFLATQAISATPQPVEPPKTEAQKPSEATKKGERPAPSQPLFKPSEVRTTGSAMVGGKRIGYQAIAGTLVVHSKGWDDTDALESAANKGDEEGDDKPKAEASMFYTAYFKNGVPADSRPITFLFNGGPGSSTVWLHMGAFGPVRVETADAVHTPPAPYGVVNNDHSLLDVSDLVFIDAPGTGFSRIAGKDKEKAFYGVDQDIGAFTQFITQFLSRYARWNSPKYVFGESYGTMRGAGLALALQDKDVDINGLVLLSDILNWDFLPDDPQINPGVDYPYIVSLPTYAATAWYHNRVADRPPDLRSFLGEVEAFATGEYALALIKGNDLSQEERQRVAGKLAAYTGLSLPYLLKTNLRIEYGAFQKELLADQVVTTGTLDTRFLGTTLDPLSKVASYDPQSSAISAAYVAAFNNYARRTLRYGEGVEFKPGIDIYGDWDYKHQPPGADKPLIALPNVLPDLAVAMKRDPDLKVMVNGGYYDVSTPYFAGKLEMRHLPVPASILGNVEYHYYESGHMVYAHPPSLKAIHDNVADFIRRTSAAH
jgi:carboxypeptidase C (cathepsin A)